MINLIKTNYKWSIAGASLAPLQRYWELFYVLVERSLKVRYRGSLLGVYWSLLNPLLMTALYTAIFGTTFASYYNDSIVDYILAAFTGLVVIHFFSGSTNQALVSVVENGILLNKIKLPMVIFPLSMVGGNVFQFCLGMLPVLAIVTLVKSHSLVNVVALLIPLLSLTLVCTGIGFFVSALYVFFRDLPYFYELVTFVLWMSSPVFYPTEIVPPAVEKFLIFNPLVPIIESVRQISLSGALPDIILMGKAGISSSLILAFGWILFRKWQEQFMDLI
ncbi:MAG: ABC transporter permease [Prochloron sp. SP5CPC1]|nr:ABC transporter permease [Candidatus Paraprochloron terpiosi SP5CPC1]